MVMSLTEPIRQLLDGFATGTIRLPVRVGAGGVYFVPSESDLGEFYIVADVAYMDKGNSMRAWVCGCKAFRFGQQGDECKHIRKVKAGLETKIKVTKKPRSQRRSGAKARPSISRKKVT
jgi:hypothetical protein